MSNIINKISSKSQLAQVFQICAWLFFFILVSIQSIAQDYATDMEKMKVAYSNVTNLHSQVSVKVFDHKGATSPVFIQQLELWKKGQQIHYSMGGLTMITGKKYSLWINKGNQEIAAQRINQGKSKNKGLTETLSPELMKAMEEMSSVEYVGKVKGLKHYRLIQKQGEIAQADIFIDNRGFLKKMEYLYRTNEEGSQHYVEVDFNEFNTQVNPADQLFDEGVYIREKGGQLTPTPQYASYQVIKTKSEINEK